MFIEQNVKIFFEMNFGKWLIFIGLGLILVGVIIWALAKVGISLGQLPGDLSIKKEKFQIHFPIITSLIISVILTIILNLIFWILRK